MMLTSKGANLFAESIGVSTVPSETLVTEYEMKEWKKHKNYTTGVLEHINTRWYASAVCELTLKIMITFSTRQNMYFVFCVAADF